MKFLISILAITSFNVHAAYTYPISTCSDLELIERHPNDNFIVVENLNCLGFDTKPINFLNGTLDGQGKTIEISLTNESSYKSPSFINSINQNASVKDISLTIYYYQKFGTELSNFQRGGLAQSNSGLISNVTISAYYNDPKSTKNSLTSGLVTINRKSGIIRDSLVEINDPSAGQFYGLAAFNYGIIDNVRVIDTRISNTEYSFTNFSGFTGFNGGEIKNSNIISYNINLKAAESYFKFSGFCEKNIGTIINSSSNIHTTIDLKNDSSNLSFISGFIGDNEGVAENNHSFLGLTIMQDKEDEFYYFRPFFGNSDDVPESNKYSWSIDYN